MGDRRWRKIRKVVMMLCFILFLSACINTDETTVHSDVDATIREAELTGLEDILTEMAAHEIFIFELQLNNDKVTKVYTAIDYYENGEFVTTLRLRNE